jgi:predicted AAA+ superfamily ATPase
LIKAKRRKELFFWRTQDKKEVDFIIKKGRDISPLEVKLAQDNFNYTSMKYFLEKYKIKNGICTCLEITKKNQRNVMFVYPWEIC